MLSQEPIKSRIGELAVGLAVDCDAPPVDGIASLMRTNLPGASTLPFVGVVTYEGKWVDGYSGFKQPAELTTFLDDVEGSPVLKAQPAVRQQLAKLAKAAVDAAALGKWGLVTQAMRDADRHFGTCPEREELRALEQRASLWLTSRFDAVLAAGISGEKLTASRKILGEVKRAFVGQPEAELAELGLKALRRLNRVRAVEARGNSTSTLREAAADEFKGTPWTALFARPGAAHPDQERGGEEVERVDEEPGVEEFQASMHSSAST